MTVLYQSKRRSSELQPLVSKIHISIYCGGSRIRTCEDISQRIYSPSQLAALVSPQLVFQEIFTSFIPFLLFKEMQKYTLFPFIQIYHEKYLLFFSAPPLKLVIQCGKLLILLRFSDLFEGIFNVYVIT